MVGHRQPWDMIDCHCFTFQDDTVKHQGPRCSSNLRVDIKWMSREFHQTKLRKPSFPFLIKQNQSSELETSAGKPRTINKLNHWLYLTTKGSTRKWSTFVMKNSTLFWRGAYFATIFATESFGGRFPTRFCLAPLAPRGGYELEYHPPRNPLQNAISWGVFLEPQKRWDEKQQINNRKPDMTIYDIPYIILIGSMRASNIGFLKSSGCRFKAHACLGGCLKCCKHLVVAQGIFGEALGNGTIFWEFKAL